jgi:hypothetical protein
MRHFGTARDAVKDGPFGCKTKAGIQSAAECLEAYPGSEIGRWQLQQQEAVYARCVQQIGSNKQFENQQEQLLQVHGAGCIWLHFM